MRGILITLTLVAMSALALFLPAVAEENAAYTQARAHLARAEFEAASSALEQAAQASPENQAYRQELAMLRQVIDLRARIGAESDAARWEQFRGALRAYYYAQDLYGEALALDREFHHRSGSAISGEALAETLLQSGDDTEARALLVGIPGDALTAKGRRLKALAYARTGGQAEAERLLAAQPSAKEVDPELLYLEARVRALLGLGDGAREALQAALRATPQGALERLRTQARGCPDFAALAGDAAFAAALATDSSVKESSCSRGATCGGCPRAASCGSGGGSGK